MSQRYIEYKRAIKSGSLEGRTGDALALEGDEGRVKLRKAAGSCKRTLIRRCPNGETRYVEDIAERQTS